VGKDRDGIAKKIPNPTFNKDLPVSETNPKEMEDVYEIGYNWSNAKQYEHMGLQYGAHGYVEEYWSGLRCWSFILVPGTQLLSNGLLGTAYLIGLLYLFLGVAIVSDIFMESIE